MNLTEGTPGKSYWATYDHLRIEREARALRNAEVRAMFDGAVRRVRAWLARTPSPRAGERTPYNAHV